jgi:serine/threonine-protein kinase HipA
MSMNGKRDGFALEDFRACAQVAGMQRRHADEIVSDVEAVVGRWMSFAAAARVDDTQAERIATTHAAPSLSASVHSRIS